MDAPAPLAPYAATPAASRGRRFAEPPPATRSEFQRDRDRIIHSTAFRRLEYKTQVFVNHEGDLFRTRLTHSIEVAQIARSIARNLRLNEDLVEAISLAHDLGHTPFGHAGQDALNACMKDFGGFEHNLQSLRVVDTLEERYGDFDGLNLTFETREGILKHCSLANARKLGEIGQRFIEKKPADAGSAAGQPGRRNRLQQPRHRRRPALRPADSRAVGRDRFLCAPSARGRNQISRHRRPARHQRNRAPHDQRADHRPDRDIAGTHPRRRSPGRWTTCATPRR